MNKRNDLSPRALMFSLVLILGFSSSAWAQMGEGNELQKCPVNSSSAVPDTGKAAIKCPFLKMAMPDTSSYKAFVQDCKANGMNPLMARFVARDVAKKQKGKEAVKRGEVPDIYNLDSVPGISHCDLFTRHLPELKSQARSMEKDGWITLQHLIEMKKRVAQHEQVEIAEPSKIETALIFIRAGGDRKTGKVKTEDVFTLLQGENPEGFGKVKASTLRKVRKMANWDD